MLKCERESRIEQLEGAVIDLFDEVYHLQLNSPQCQRERADFAHRLTGGNGIALEDEKVRQMIDDYQEWRSRRSH